MADRFSGKVAIITGGASGIGAATAQRLVREGASVVITDLQEDLGWALVAELGQNASFERLDVSDEQGWERVMTAVSGRHGRLDSLVNSAGIAGWGSIDDTTSAGWRKTLDVNAFGSYLGCRYAVAAMRQNGGGSIVNVSSAMAVKADPNQLAYCASKAAVLHMTRCIALDCAQKGYGIRCNAVLPGGVDTPLLGQMSGKLGGRKMLEDLMASAHPVGRMGTPDEIAATIAFLLSDDAGFITASAYAVDGGMAES